MTINATAIGIMNLLFEICHTTIANNADITGSKKKKLSPKNIAMIRFKTESIVSDE